MPESVLVIRGGKALRQVDGDLPTLYEVNEHFVVVSSRNHKGLIVVESSIGEAPNGWQWVNVVELQGDLDPDDAARVGEALLCA